MFSLNYFDLLDDASSRIDCALQVEFSALPAVFGGAVYSFMTHHSIPSMVTPCRSRNGANGQLLKLIGIR